MDSNIYNKLTESAKSALNETMEEVAEMIIEKAYQNANLKNTGDKEISLRDIIEAKEEVLYKRVHTNKEHLKRKQIGLTLSMTGAVYAALGIIFYLYQNKMFDSSKDLGLIVAVLGILISIITFYYSQLTLRRKDELIKDTSIIEKDNSEFEIVRRWQAIEKLGTDLMTNEGLSDNRSKSFNAILNFLAEQLPDNLKMDNLKRILMARNQIVHNGKNLSKVEIDGIIKMADEIIDELERKKKHSS